MHNAALKAVGLADWRYERIAIPPDIVGHSLRTLRDEGGFLGLNVTVPHKQAVLPHVRPDEVALALGAARAPELEVMSWFAGLLDETLNTEMELHRGYCAQFGITREEAEWEAHHPGAMGQHALDRQMGLARVRRAKQRGDGGVLGVVPNHVRKFAAPSQFGNPKERPHEAQRSTIAAMSNLAVG